MIQSVIHLLRAASIRMQLLAFATFTCLIAVTICCLSLLWSDWQLVHEMKKAEVESLAKMMAFNSGAVVTFMQEDSANELLAALDSQPSVTLAVLYTNDGDLVGLYRPDAATEVPSADSLQPGTTFADNGYIECVQPIEDIGERVGTLVMYADTSQIRESLWSLVCTALVVLVVSLLIAASVALAISKLLTGPIQSLADAAHRISTEEDFAVRVTTGSQNEIGDLYQAFNGMLDRVEQSKAALSEINDHLEDRVRDRTAQLEQEIENREQTHRELVRAKEDAETANRAKSEFLANMSHEIRTPMNAILGFTDLLRRHPVDGDPAERDDYLETIHTSGGHLLNLINDILDLSKVESGRMETERISVSPHQVVAEAVSVMRVPAREKGLTLDYHWDSPIPAVVHTDPSRFRQLLINLIGNAVKFTAQGAVTVRAALRRPVDSASPLLVIDVVDTGIGIKREKLEEIFSPFAQADSSVTRQFGGTGLGLTISRRLARQLGGDLEVESEEGAGSIFTVSIATGSLDGIEILAGPPSADVVRDQPDRSVAAPPKLLPAKILVVEDGETNRRLINKMLVSLGHDVTLAENGRIGVDRASRETFDIILMDMQMPVLDGYGAATELKSLGSTTPVIALTAHAMMGDREKCLAAGCVDYLTKPISETELVWKLSDYLPVDLTSDDAPGVSSASTDRSSSPVATSPEAARLRSTLPYDDEDYREIIEDFIAIAVTRTAEAATSLSKSDWTELKNYAHWLRGTAGTAGFESFSIPAQKLETAALANDFASATAAFANVTGLVDRLGPTSNTTPVPAGT